jgi:hypothetical protein
MITVELTKPPKRWVQVVGRVEFGSHFAKLVLLRDKERRQKKIEKTLKKIRKLEESFWEKSTKFKQEIQQYGNGAYIPDPLAPLWFETKDLRAEIVRLKKKLRELEES